VNTVAPALPDVVAPPPAKSTEVALPPQTTPEKSPVGAVCWGLSQGDRWLLGGCGGLAILLLAAHLAIRDRWGTPTIEVASLHPREWHYSVEINSATWVEWLQLPDIGEALAHRIVDDRDERGPFRSVEDVSRVRGVGPKTLAQIRPFLRLDSDPVAANPAPQ
jgi:competence protein ComEA